MLYGTKLVEVKGNLFSASHYKKVLAARKKAGLPVPKQTLLRKFYGK